MLGRISSRPISADEVQSTTLIPSTAPHSRVLISMYTKLGSASYSTYCIAIECLRADRGSVDSTPLQLPARHHSPRLQYVIAIYCTTTGY
eukprot:scaffold1091_cov164-Ochromonas_danica.AAC.83